MSLPLYDVVRQAPPTLTSDSHHGLWFDRFFDQFDGKNPREDKRWQVLEPHKDKDKAKKEPQGRAHWLTSNFNKEVGDKTLGDYAAKQVDLVEKYLQGQCLTFKASWHFVTGMGNPHPVENGFAWHPTLGVPYLTGAAVKGIIRAYIDNYPYQEPNEPLKKELLLNWFGSTSKQPNDKDYQAQGGTLIFFDALPTQPVTLGVDIMTPHMGGWYADGAKAQKVGTPDAVPADWHDPVPVTFLVAKEITLLFSFALRPTAPPQDKAALKLDDVAYVLEQALQYAGAGAKTATGYGSFATAPEVLTALEKTLARQQAEIQAKREADVQKAQKEAQLAALSPLEQELEQLTHISEWINALESKRWQGDQLKEAAIAIKQRMQTKGKWLEQTKAKKPEKDKIYQATLKVKKFL